jgi:hypothetical protein
MAEVEQRRKQLPTRTAMTEVEQRRDVGIAAARAAKVRRNAWLLAGLAVFFYVGYIAWMFVRSNGG